MPTKPPSKSKTTAKLASPAPHADDVGVRLSAVEAKVAQLEKQMRDLDEDEGDEFEDEDLDEEEEHNPIGAKKVPLFDEHGDPETDEDEDGDDEDDLEEDEE